MNYMFSIFLKHVKITCQFDVICYLIHKIIFMYNFELEKL